MPYVTRDVDGVVDGLYANLQPGWAEEWLEDDAAEVVAFLNPPPPIPGTISDRQFFQQLAIMGLITEEEALAYVSTGALPSAFNDFIGSLPEPQRFNAKMLIIGAQTFQRSHPLVAQFGAMNGMSSAQIDDLWREASTL
ncbi:hypothetical protein HQ945_08280 [Phyllobacterium sp. BT25]|uniref:Uncharacterized protein n=1 Tax=Phyllobacterium pellucidum TaxID=2740464 RepID=A0A849VT74_9HYPH|nr:hypothetical protein [Phyllobacterium pellucidum]NTS31250.1 hypothetical protein [Phyllobacterium pellucidum]